MHQEHLDRSHNKSTIHRKECISFCETEQKRAHSARVISAICMGHTVWHRKRTPKNLNRFTMYSCALSNFLIRFIALGNGIHFYHVQRQFNIPCYQFFLSLFRSRFFCGCNKFWIFDLQFKNSALRITIKMNKLPLCFKAFPSFTLWLFQTKHQLKCKENKRMLPLFKKEKND